MRENTKFLSFLLAILMVFSHISTVSAASTAHERDPYTIKGRYVKELIYLSEDELSALMLSEAEALFEKAFGVPANSYTEDEIRLGLDGLAFGLKYQKLQEDLIRATGVTTSSTTGNITYTGSIGIAWVRDTTKSPLTLGEILSGVYTLEVDWLTYETAAIILAASADYNIYSELVDAVVTNAGPAAITAIICAALGGFLLSQQREHWVFF